MRKSEFYEVSDSKVLEFFCKRNSRLKNKKINHEHLEFNILDLLDNLNIDPKELYIYNEIACYMEEFPYAIPEDLDFSEEEIEKISENKHDIIKHIHDYFLEYEVSPEEECFENELLHVIHGYLEGLEDRGL